MAIPFNQLNPIQFNPESALFEHVARQLTKENPSQPFRDLDDLLNRLEPIAANLGCATELAAVEGIYRGGGSYQRQLRVAEASGGDLRAVVDSLVAELDTP